MLILVKFSCDSSKFLNFIFEPPNYYIKSKMGFVGIENHLYTSLMKGNFVLYAFKLHFGSAEVIVKLTTKFSKFLISEEIKEKIG